MSDGNLKIGDLVWAKMKGFSPWPGKVSKPIGNMKRPKTSKATHCIWFFGSNNFAWIEEYSIKPYEKYKESLSKACKSAPFKEACAAIEDYIARKEAGENVDKEFEEQEENDYKEEDGSTMDRSQEGGGGSGEEADVLSDAEPESPVGKKRRVTSTEDSADELAPKKEATVTPKRKKKTTENGEAKIKLDIKTPKKTRRVSAKDSEPSSSAKKVSAVSNHAPRKSAAASLLDRPTGFSRPEFTPLNVGHVSQTLKDKQITPSKMRFGFLGLGIMGSGMVKNLINSGHSVVVWNRTPDKCKDFVEAGADQGMTPSDVIASADITFSCVSDPLAAKDMVFGNCGVLCEMDANKGYVEMTGVDSESSQDIADAVGGKGGRYLEAQIQGSKTESEEGTLVIMAAGDRSLYEDCQSTFNAMSKASFFLGDVGSASKMNLVLQVINGVCLSGLAEGMALADRANLKQADVLEILGLTNMSCGLIREKGQAIMEGSFPVHQPLQHLQKDLNMALNMGHQLEQPLPLAATANEVFKHAKRLGYGEHDASAVYIRARF